jgi:hypothetical protein
MQAWSIGGCAACQLSSQVKRPDVLGDPMVGFARNPGDAETRPHNQLRWLWGFFLFICYVIV